MWDSVTSSGEVVNYKQPNIPLQITASSIQVLEVYLELLHAAWDGEGGAAVLHVLRLLLLGLLCLLLQHRLADLQQ